MSTGIFLWYVTLFTQNIRGDSIVASAAAFGPLFFVGTAAAVLSGWLVGKMQAQYIVAIGNASLVISNTLLATTPRHQSYWTMLFPAVFIVSFSLDFVYAATQALASASVGRERQGAAGSLIGTLLNYGLSTGLGFAGTVEVYTNNGGEDVLGGYRHAIYLAIGLAAFGLVGSVFLLRVPQGTTV
jgi:MFS family permease